MPLDLEQAPIDSENFGLTWHYHITLHVVRTSLRALEPLHLRKNIHRNSYMEQKRKKRFPAWHPKE
jgi:hypothetical protein